MSRVWLVALSGDPPRSGWGYAHPETRKMMNFPRGVYDVTEDDVTQDFARRAESPQLLLVEAESPPEYVYPYQLLPPGSALSPEHFRLSADDRILLAAPEIIEKIAEARGDDRSLTYPCPECGAQFPHAAPLRRHVERSHNDQAADHLPLVPEPEPEPEPEPALTDA